MSSVTHALSVCGNTGKVKPFKPWFKTQLVIVSDGLGARIYRSGHALFFSPELDSYFVLSDLQSG